MSLFHSKKCCHDCVFSSATLALAVVGKGTGA